MLKRFQDELKEAVTYVEDMGYWLFIDADYSAEYSNNSDWNIIFSADPRDSHLYVSLKYKPKDKKFHLGLLGQTLYNLFKVVHPKGHDLKDLKGWMEYIKLNVDMIFQDSSVYEEEYDKVQEARWHNQNLTK